MAQLWKTFGEKLLKSTPYGVRVEADPSGEFVVVLTIGRVSCRMRDTMALRLSAFLRHAGRRAKRENGGGRLWTPYCDLTPENAEELNAAMSVDRTVITAKR